MQKCIVRTPTTATLLLTTLCGGEKLFFPFPNMENEYITI